MSEAPQGAILAQPNTHWRRWVVTSIAFMGVGLSAGFGVVYAPILTVSVVATGMVLPSIVKHLGSGSITWLMITGLMLWSYGFNNIPLGPIRVPIVEPLLVGIIIATHKLWIPALNRYATLRRLMILCIIYLSIFLIRLPLDLPSYGMTAMRDALPAIDAFAILAGAATAQKAASTQSSAALTRTIELTAALLVAWYLFQPGNDWVIKHGPSVGIQYPVPLMSFSAAGVVSVSLIGYYLTSQSKRPILLTLAVITFVFAQYKGAYIALVFLLLLIMAAKLLRHERTVDTPRPLRRLLLMGSISLAILTLAPPIPGRVAPVTLETVRSQLSGLAGNQAAVGGGSVEQRNKFNDATFEAVRSAPMGQLIGAGLGTDLVGGFKASTGAPVRKPHNDYLEAYGRLGIVGLVTFLSLVGYVFLLAFRAYRVGVPHAGGLFSFIAATVAIGATEPTFAFAYGAVPFYFFGGLLAVAYDRHRQSDCI